MREEPAREARPGAKNRPTPKRREQEAARRRPLVETDRKAARERDKQARKEAFAKQQQAMRTGDDRGLPARDRGPKKRYIRDMVDARWNIGEFLLPAMLMSLALSLVKTQWAYTLMFFLVYGLMLLAIIDVTLLWRRTKKGLKAKFGEDGVPRGGLWYLIMRSFQFRRIRMPRPMVNRDGTPV